MTIRRFAATVVVLLALAAGACSRIDPNLTPEQQQQVHLQRMKRAAEVVERVGNAVRAIQAYEIVLYHQGRIAPDTHAAIQTYFKYGAEGVITAIDEMKKLTTPASGQLETIRRALGFVDSFQRDFVDKLPDEQARNALGLLVLSAQVALLTWQIIA